MAISILIPGAGLVELASTAQQFPDGLSQQLATVAPASITNEISSADTGNSPNTSGAFTPATGDLLVVFVLATETTDAQGTLSNSAGITFTFITKATYTGLGANQLYLFVADSLITSGTAVSQTCTWTHSSDVASGTTITVVAVAGMSPFVGASAVRQTAKTESGSGGGTPAATFSIAALAKNPTLAAMGNATNPAGVTPPLNWTEASDTGHASPVTGFEYGYRNSEFAGTTITWGGTSASNYATLIVELNAPLPVAKPVGLSEETDSALSLSRKKLKAVGRADETDTAFSLTPPISVGRADSVETAFALSGKKIRATGRADSTESALTLVGKNIRAIGRSDTSETAISLVGKKIRSHGRADETETALATTGKKVLLFGRADSSETAFGPAGKKARIYGRSDEADTAIALVGSSSTSVGRADETDTAFALTGRKLKLVGRADETDTSIALTPPVTVYRSVGMAVERNIAFSRAPMTIYIWQRVA